MILDGWKEENVRVHLASLYCTPPSLFFSFSFLDSTWEGNHVLLCKEFVGETDSML